MFRAQIADLHRKIILLLEIGYKNLRGLKNIHIKELFKVVNGSETKRLPVNGKLCEHMQSEDLLLYEIDSLDMWVKINLHGKENDN
jgi:hypothetical protein